MKPFSSLFCIGTGDPELTHEARANQLENEDKILLLDKEMQEVP